MALRTNSLTRYSDAADVAVVVFDMLYGIVEPDPRVPVVRMSHESVDKPGGRRGMEVELRWPKAHEADAAQFATQQLQRFAAGVNLHGNSRLNVADDMVYVQAIRSRGMIIETNPLGSCNISAGEPFYDPESATVELWQHNLYSAPQQLACLMGAVSFATADMYLET